MFALACLSCWALIIRFACSSADIDHIEVESRTRLDLVQRKEVHSYEKANHSRDRISMDPRRLFTKLLFELRPSIACGYPCSQYTPVLKPKVQNTKVDFRRTTALRRGVHSNRFSTAAMVSIEVATPWLGAVAAASAHGLTDFRRQPIFLAPYLLLFAPIPTEFVTVLFIFASIQHFSHDIGIKPSVLLHTTFATLAPVLPQIAWSIFALFYCAYHAPMHYVRHLNEVDGRLVAIILVVAMSSGLCMHGVESFELTDTMQLGVIAHIAADEIEKGSTSLSNWFRNSNGFRMKVPAKVSSVYKHEKKEKKKEKAILR